MLYCLRYYVVQYIWYALVQVHNEADRCPHVYNIDIPDKINFVSSFRNKQITVLELESQSTASWY